MFFYQLPNSNLFTHRMLFFSREATSEIYNPHVYLLTYCFEIIFIRICFRIYYSKNPKILCGTFYLHLLFRVLFRSIYPNIYKTDLSFIILLSDQFFTAFVFRSIIPKTQKYFDALFICIFYFAFYLDIFIQTRTI